MNITRRLALSALLAATAVLAGAGTASAHHLVICVHTPAGVICRAAPV